MFFKVKTQSGDLYINTDNISTFHPTENGTTLIMNNEDVIRLDISTGYFTDCLSLFSNTQHIIYDL